MIMNTTGHHPHLISQAVGSFLAQTEQCKLMINCIHPDGLHLDKEYDNITINNIKPFNKYPEQIAWGISQVDTPYWCVLDSDDYILPWHVEQLLEGIKYCKQMPLVSCHAVGCDKYWQLENGGVSKHSSGGWWRLAFTIRDNEWLKTTARQFQTTYAYDSFLFKRTQCKVIMDTKPSYVYRLGESWHVSQRGDIPKFKELPVIIPEVNDVILLLCN